MINACNADITNNVKNLNDDVKKLKLHTHKFLDDKKTPIIFDGIENEKNIINNNLYKYYISKYPEIKKLLMGKIANTDNILEAVANLICINKKDLYVPLEYNGV